MKDLRSKKAIAASLSLTLALGSVPAVALADDADENSEGATSEQSTQAELSFSANGGQFTDGSTGVTVKANEDGSINAPTPTRAGYTFKGWYSQSSMDGIPENYQQYYKLDPSSAKAGSWFAAWEKNAEVQAQSVEVVSFFQGGERDGSSVTTTIDVTADSSVADCVKSFEGYTPTKIVSGAATSEEEVNMTSSLEGITTLYVYYKADEQKTEQNQINVLYAANGGQFVDGNETMQGVADSDGVMRQPAAPTREGYTFAGWYWVSDLSGLTDEQKDLNKVDFSQSIAGKDHATIYAQWTKNADQNEIDVLYAANGGQFATGETFQQGLTDSDGMMRQPAEPTREGYTFDGWYWVSDLSGLTDEQKDLNKVDFSQSVAGKEHVTVFAQWTKNQEQNDHAVMYVANGGQFATGETFQQGVTDSDGMMRQPAAPTREGYTFDGWYWHADYSGYTDEQKAAEKKVEEAQEKVDQKTREIEGYQEKLGTRARDMYRSGNTGFLDVILGASSFEQFATTWNTLERLNENDAELVTETKNAREELENAKQEAEEQAEVAANKAAEAKSVKDEAEATTAQMQQTYDSLSAEAQELMRKEEEAAEKARQEAAAREAAAAAAASKNNGGGTVDNSAVQTVTGNTVVDRAYAQLGKPYVWGAAGPNSFDCSGLVGYCITGKMGNHWCTTYTMASWKRVTNPQPGDFCLNSHHTGVYIGNGQMIHAPRTGDVVKISAVHSGMWYVRY